MRLPWPFRRRLTEAGDKSQLGCVHGLRKQVTEARGGLLEVRREKRKVHALREEKEMARSRGVLERELPEARRGSEKLWVCCREKENALDPLS